MNLLASKRVHVLPPSSERNSALFFDSIIAYKTCGLEGATASAIRPQGFAGRPLLLVSFISVQWSPPSVDSNSPLPGPPERKSQVEAKTVFGACGDMASIPQPVEPLAPARTFFQVLPPSDVLKTPRSSLSFQTWPVAQARMLLLSWGSMRILAMCSESFKPMLVQFSPPSVDLYMPSPIETLFLVHASPEPTQTILEFEGSMATDPIDCTDWRSNTGLKVVPPFTDFQTPPLAAPTNTVRRPFSLTAATAATRPLMVAEPMLRAGNPEIVAASNFTACWAKTAAEMKKHPSPTSREKLRGDLEKVA